MTLPHNIEIPDLTLGGTYKMIFLVYSSIEDKTSFSWE